MKNILTIENGIAILLSNVDDGTNTIFINGAEIPASSWVGSGVYQYTESGVTFTIQKTNANTGNIMLQLVQGTAYRLVKQFEGEPYNSGDPLDTDLADDDYMPFYDTSAGTRKNSLWSNIVDKIKSAITNLYWHINGGMTEIPAWSGNSVDLNTYTTPGNYTCKYNAGSQYITNQPRTSSQVAFDLVVIREVNSSGDYCYGRQILYYYNSNDFWTRTYASSPSNPDGIWSDWSNWNKDTWRGIQNNLTSDSTTDSLSAAQGKALSNTKVDRTGDTMSGNLTIDKKNGTPNVEAWSYVMLGNNTPVTQDKNSTGVIRFFTQGTSYIDLFAAKTDAVRYQQLQNKSGTIALLSDTNPFVSIDNKTTLAEVGAAIDAAFTDLGNDTGALWGYCFANTCSALGWWESGATLFCISNSTTFRQAVFLCNGSPSIRIIYKNEGVWRELNHNGFAPYPHAANSTHYGGGNDTNYGHVKLSDSYTTSGGAASASVAASSKAVADLYSAIRNRNGSVATTAINSSTAPGIIVHPAFLGFFGNIRVNRTSATEIVSGTYNGNTNRYAPLLSLTAANAQAILANKMPTTTGPINPIFVTPSGLSSSASAFSWFLYRKDANTYYILNTELSAANDTELNAKLNGKDYIYKIVGQCLFKY